MALTDGGYRIDGQKVFGAEELGAKLRNEAPGAESRNEALGYRAEKRGIRLQSLENLNRPGVKAYWGRGILFCLVVVVSLIYHLPASWLAAQIAPALPKYLVTSMWQGTLWQGQVTLNWQTPQTRVHLGRLQWQVKPWQVLFLEGGVALQWAPGHGTLQTANTVDSAQSVTAKRQQATVQQTIHAELTVPLFSPDRIHIKALQGQMPVARLAQILAVYQPLPGAFEGLLAFDIRSLDWRFADALPEAVNGQITLSNFNAMGVEIPQMTLVPKREEALLVLSMQGGDTHWHLQGSAGLNAQRYQIDAAIKADSEAAMPSWGAWLLHKTSPMEAVFSQAGRW